MPTCPFCAETIPTNVGICPYCGKTISSSQSPREMKTCPFCAETIPDDSTRCPYCDKELDNDSEGKHQEPHTRSKQVYSNAPGNYSRCELCGANAPTAKVQFHQNIGLFVRRLYRKVDGRLCRDCIEETFWPFTGKTLLFGWFGVISFMVSPFILLINVMQYLGTLGVKRAPGRSGPRDSNPWKPITILLILGLCVYVGVSINDMGNVPARPSTSTSSQIQTSSSSSNSFRAPTRTSALSNASSSCLRWNQVTLGYVGRDICVTGNVYAAYQSQANGSPAAFFITFSPDAGAFYVLSYEWAYPQLRQGNCVVVKGEVTRLGSSPIILIEYHDDLYPCE